MDVIEDLGIVGSPYVVLLHGLGRDESIMQPCADFFRRLGYDVYNPSYPSTEHGIEELAESVYEGIINYCSDTTKPIHFVTHSLGGIITRYMIEHSGFINLGRVAMIAPPNKGTKVVDFLKKFKFYRNSYGKAGIQLGTDPDSVPLKLGPLDADFGVIAGIKSVDPWFSWFILRGEMDDGKVTVESTKLSGMRDHIILKEPHPTMPTRPDVIYQAAHYIKYGKFKHLEGS